MTSRPRPPRSRPATPTTPATASVPRSSCPPLSRELKEWAFRVYIRLYTVNTPPKKRKWEKKRGVYKLPNPSSVSQKVSLLASNWSGSTTIIRLYDHLNAHRYVQESYKNTKTQHCKYSRWCKYATTATRTANYFLGWNAKYITNTTTICAWLRSLLVTQVDKKIRNHSSWWFVRPIKTFINHKKLHKIRNYKSWPWWRSTESPFQLLVAHNKSILHSTKTNDGRRKSSWLLPSTSNPRVKND